MKNYILMLIAATVLNLGAASNAPVTAAGSNAVTTVTNAAVAAASRTPATGAPNETFWSQYGSLLIWTLVIGTIFAIMWRKGYLLKIRGYIEETQEELRKCTWPSRDELKGSTVVVVVTITLLGVFTVGVDAILMAVMRAIM